MQTKVPLIVAIVFGLVAFFGIGNYLQKQKIEQQFSKVIAMNKDKKAGERIELEDLVLQPVPAETLKNVRGFYKDNQQGILVGQRLARDMKPLEIILESSLVSETPGDRSVPFATFIKPGERALSLTIDNAGMVTGLIRPGDQVDILANLNVPETVERSMTIPNQGIQTYQEVTFKQTTVFLLENVKVLAMGENYLESDPFAEPTRALGGNTVTIAVTPKEGQVLTYAMRNGSGQGPTRGNEVTFTLLLRSGTDDGTVGERTVVDYQDLLNMTDLQKLQSVRDTRRKEEKTEVYVGGEQQK